MGNTAQKCDYTWTLHVLYVDRIVSRVLTSSRYDQGQHRMPFGPAKTNGGRVWSSTKYQAGVFSGIVGNQDWLATFGNPDSGLEGIIVAIYDLGAFCGCILTFIIGERLGRRRAMWLAMFFIIV